MINKDRDSNLKDLEENLSKEQKPNESTGIYVRGFVRITDPESGEILLETGN